MAEIDDCIHCMNEGGDPTCFFCKRVRAQPAEELNLDQYIRITALEAAVASVTDHEDGVRVSTRSKTGDIIDRAKTFERYIQGDR